MDYATFIKKIYLKMSVFAQINFPNEGQFKAGFAKELFLKDGSSVTSRTSECHSLLFMYNFLANCHLTPDCFVNVMSL